MARSMPKPTSPTPAAATPAPAHAGANQVARSGTGSPTYEQIARRAYEIYEARGRQHGRDVEDWLQAERELRLGRN